MSERLTFGVAAISLTNRGFGTGSRQHDVTDRLATGVTASVTNSALVTAGIAVIVSECLKHLYSLLAANCTVVNVLTGSSTRRSCTGDELVIVAYGMNYLLLDSYRLTARALNTLGKTVNGTSRSLSLKNEIVKMTESRLLIGYFAIAANRAGVAGITGLGTGGFYSNNLIFMTESFSLGSFTSLASLRCGTIRLYPCMTGSLCFNQSAGSAGFRCSTGYDRPSVTKGLTPSLLTY